MNGLRGPLKVRSRAKQLGLTRDFYSKIDVHIHVPEGATPKDGPSAGITLVTALVSALSGRCAKGEVAMTGEITLRGRVLPVGGVKDKVLAAHRAGIREIVLPSDNRNDLEEIPDDVRASLVFHFADHVRDVLAVAFPADG